MSNEDACKKVNEIEDSLNNVEGAVVYFFAMKILLLLGHRRTFVSCKVL